MRSKNSLHALRKASTTSYYKGNGSLWIKLVSIGAGVSLQASR